MAIPSSAPFNLTGDALVDAATNGYYWTLDASRTIRWSVAGGLFGEVWLDPARVAAQITPIFDAISYYANVRFEYTGAYSSPVSASPYSDITISLSGSPEIFSSASAWGRAFFSNTSYNGIYYTGAPGDVFLNVNSEANSLPSYAPGSAGYFLFMHEIGHALGLKHPHDDGGTGRPTLQDLGMEYMDNDWFTVMSYQDDYDYNDISWDPATPMLMDVLALQYLYGKNMQTNAGDTTHSLLRYGDYITLWDAGGLDTASAAASDEGWIIALPDTRPSAIVDTSAGFAIPLSDAIETSPTSFYWLTGDIENANGSNYDDVITGSASPNWIAGNGGDDMMYARGGNDIFVNIAGKDGINGGDGADILWVNFSSSDAGIAKLRDNSFLIQDSADNIAICRDVETVRLSDRDVPLSAVAAYSGIDASLVQIYVAGFRRAPEKEGYNYWAQQKNAQGLEAVADTIFSLDIVKAIYPTTLSPTSFVTSIYQNVFDKAPDAEGLAYWSNQLATHSRGQLVINMTNAALGVADEVDGKDFFQNRVDWGIFSVGHLTASQKEATPAQLTALTARVDEDPLTLLTLVGQVDAGQILV
ncbi:DUF4214 domain-containing protein [Noviherbaspirillum sp.]|uniref:DUF4214 domain-containing protein n=1 Tax=Noviherbaspirillum sp. TaxID=1926288 RepID=UPI002D3D653B|nr:DUF4214 domain-containing protein [Noviherbaspirillum sp.]HZW20831.1 DUF4214 domain-containing protein [Noviherbaspirillum sp.]